MYDTVTPEAAHNLVSNEGYVYIDVRTEPEYDAGHPVGSINIPVVFIEPGVGMVPNPEFLSVVEANFPPDTKFVLGCKSGGRSARAAEMLVTAGYRQVVNMDGGFDGRFGPMQNLVQEGWRACNLPIATGKDDENGYPALRSKQS